MSQITKAQKLLRELDHWSNKDLNELFLLIDALIESRQQLPEIADKQTDKLSDSNNGKRIAGHIEIKQIPTGKNKTKPYRYLRYWQNGKLKSTYLGKVE